MDNADLALCDEIATELARAHSAGTIEVPLAALASALNRPPEQLKGALALLDTRGALDPSDRDGFYSLSAKGLRAARDIISNNFSFRSTAAAQHDQIESDGARGHQLKNRTLSFAAMQIRRAVTRWEAVVDESNLGEQEKRRLIQLGNELFNHPAALELLLRALERE
jgi:hypothetical protein